MSTVLGDGDELLPRVRQGFAPGAVHLPGWLDLATQQSLVRQCRNWSAAPAPMRAIAMRNGSKMSVQTVCLGWHWLPYRYSRTADDTDGAPVKPFPDELGVLGRAAVADAYADGPYATDEPYSPDAALINFYDATAKMGMHQDKDERDPAPVVSLSIGDTAVFRFGNAENRGRPYRDVELRSGDVVVFGGPSRFTFHGVPRIRPGTADPVCGMTGGRLNITLRVTGLS